MAHADQSSLPRRAFGRTGLDVTPICLGCAPIGNMPDTFYPVSEDEALAMLRAVFRSPINFLDTAASYGDGESERRIGLALRELGGLPEGYVLATKADRNLQTGDFSGEQMKRSIERSLRLLGVDRLEILWLHDPETSTFEQIMSKGGAVEVLQSYKEQGVIGTLGLAGGPIDLMIQYVETGAFEAVLTHNRYTLVTRSAEPLIALAIDRGMTVLNAAPYGGGMLAKGPDQWGKFAYQEASPDMVERVRRIDAMCKAHDVPLAAAALQFSLRDPRITSTVIGTAQPERLAQTIALAQHPIPDEVWTAIEALVGAEAQKDPQQRDW